MKNIGNEVEVEEGQGRGRRGGKQARKEARVQKGALTHGLADLGEIIQVPATVPASIRTIVQEAQELQSATRFPDFVFQGNDATLYVPDNAGGGVIFKYVIDGEERVFEVLRSEDPKLPAGFAFVSVALSEFADSGMDRYFPRADVEDLYSENMFARAINILYGAIQRAGGQRAVVMELERRKRQAEMEAECKERAARILADMKNGKLLGTESLLPMFDVESGNQFGIVVDGKPMVLRSGNRPINRKETRYAHCLVLVSAPYGTTGEYGEQVFVQVTQIFDEMHLFPDVTAFAAMVASLFSEEQREEAERIVHQLRGKDGTETESPEQGAGVQMAAAPPPVPMQGTATIN